MTMMMMVVVVVVMFALCHAVFSSAVFSSPLIRIEIHSLFILSHTYTHTHSLSLSPSRYPCSKPTKSSGAL